MGEQIFDSADIPSTLWESGYVPARTIPKGKLKVPKILRDAYRQVLLEKGLLETAEDISNRNSEIYGDDGEDGANEHFAKRFSGSCSRVQLFTLDPHQTFKSTRDAFTYLFAGGRVRLLDIPVGAGAGAFALICLLATLRSEANRVFPSVDLKIEIVGGDKNPHSIKLAKRLFDILRPTWLRSSIEVSLELDEWDVLDDVSTDSLIDKWKQKIDGSVPAIIGANFSGFLGKTVAPGGSRRYIDDAESTLRHIFAAAARLGAVVFWIEPSGKPANDHLLPKLRSQVLARFRSLPPRLDHDPGSQAATQDLLVPGGEFVTRVTGIHLARAHKT